MEETSSFPTKNGSMAMRQGGRMYLKKNPKFFPEEAPEKWCQRETRLSAPFERATELQGASW